MPSTAATSGGADRLGFEVIEGLHKSILQIQNSILVERLKEKSMPLE